MPGRYQTGSIAALITRMPFGAHDVAVDRDAAGGDRLADFRHVDVGAGDRDRRADVVAAREIVAELLADQMSPRIERHDLLGIGPLRIRADMRGRRGVGEVGQLVGLERLGRDGERAVDRIAAGMHADRVAMAGIAQRRDHRAALGGGRRAPHEFGRRRDVAVVRRLRCPLKGP